MADFEPKIIAFLCNWCAYAGADLAGVSRMQYPSNIRSVRVMCSGRVDPVFIIKAFKEGWDGALVAGWHKGDCHYLEGNINAEKKMDLTKRLLDIIGIGSQRLHLEWLSSAEAARFQKIVSNVTASVKECGKLDIKKFKMQLDAAEMTLSDETLRWLVGKEAIIVQKGDVYGRKWTEDDYKSKMNSILEREYHKNLIYLAIKQKCVSVRDISKKTGIALLRISYLLADLEKKKRVEFNGMKERTPVFAAL